MVDPQQHEGRDTALLIKKICKRGSEQFKPMLSKGRLCSCMYGNIITHFFKNEYKCEQFLTENR